MRDGAAVAAVLPCRAARVWPVLQWHREVLRVKKKDTAGAAKVAARMLPSGAQKIRRGGWCECCERQYIGTMSEVSGDGAREEVRRTLAKL